jgi:hypothetical protein
MFGGFHSWFSTKLAGLDTTTNATSTGWRHVVVAPSPASILRLQAAAISIETRFGHTALSWTYDVTSGRLAVNLTVPVGSHADVRLPPLAGMTVAEVIDMDTMSVWRGGWAQEEPAGVHAVHLTDDHVLALSIGSGSYNIVASYAK